MQVADEEREKRIKERKSLRERHQRWKTLFFVPRSQLPAAPPLPAKRSCGRWSEPLAHSIKLARILCARNKLRAAATAEANSTITDYIISEADENENLTSPKEEQRSERLKLERQEWNPFRDTNIQGDPRSTIIVAHLSEKTDDVSLQEFGQRFGRVLSVRVVKDRFGNSRQYGFIRFSCPQEQREALRLGSGSMLDGTSVVVDAERARVTASFVPKRFRSEAS